MFDELCNEKIHLQHKDGRQTGPLKAVFGKDKFTIMDGSLDVVEGDSIDRPLPNGKSERYDILEVKFTHAFHSIPAHVELKVRKQGASVSKPIPRVTNNISITNSQGFQVGDHNTQNIVDSFKQLIERIEKSPALAAEKTEAKSRLKAFLEHPLTSTIIGSALGSVTGLLG